MSNVLSDDKQKQVIALGQLGWTLRRIEKQTRIRRETSAGYIRPAGVPVRAPGRWGRLPPLDSKPAKEVTTGPAAARPANEAGRVTTDSGPPRPPRSPSSSACLPYHERLYFPRRSNMILQGAVRNLQTQIGLPAEKTARLVGPRRQHFAEAWVTGDEPLIGRIGRTCHVTARRSIPSHH